MNENEATLRHLLDLCRRSERTGSWQYSGFLTPAEQDELLRSPEAARYAFILQIPDQGNDTIPFFRDSFTVIVVEQLGVRRH